MTKIACPTNKKQAVQAIVVKLDTITATVQIDNPGNKHCIHCQRQGGCQSLSIYQLFFAKRPLTISNQGYTIGQQLVIDFPEDIIQKTVYYLLGLPLLGFLLGIFLGQLQHELIAFVLGVLFAGIGLLLGRKQVNKQLHQLHITTQNHTKPAK